MQMDFKLIETKKKKDEERAREEAKLTAKVEAQVAEEAEKMQKQFEEAKKLIDEIEAKQKTEL